MPVLVVEHAADCGPALLADWLSEAGVELDRVRCWAGDRLPASPEGHAGLIVLGGEMGAYDDEIAPWLPATRSLLAQAAAADLPTLAVCLGHQLLAVAAGGRVERAATGRQLGALPVGLTDAGESDPLLGRVGPHAHAIHWNHDLVVRLPPGATELARTTAGNQAFRLNSSVWGVQFHPEVGVAELQGWADAEPVPADVLAAMIAAEPALHATWRAFAHRFAARVQERLTTAAAPD